MDTLPILQEDLRRDGPGTAHFAEALRESEERLRTLIDAMPDIVCFKHDDGRWLVANDPLVRLFQLQTVDYVGRRDAELAQFVPFFAETLAASSVADEEAWERGLPTHSEQWIPTLEGPARLYDISRVPLLHPDGRRKGLVLLGRDITRRKAMEEALLESRKLDSLAILAGGIAHDFNNILTAIIGNLSLARIVTEPTGQLQEWLTRAEAASLRARELVEQLLTFARSGTPLKKATGIGELVRETAGFVLRGSNVRLVSRFPDDLRQVAVDEGQIGQVIHSVVINADQAMPEGGIIEISGANVDYAPGEHELLPAGHYVRIAVRDQGVGIDRRHLGKVFDPYFSTKQKGCGMGLAISYSIVKNHQGTIGIDSELGVGTTVCITLPAEESDLELEPEALPSTGVGAGRVLLMEDEPMVRQVAGDMLSTLGYQVAFARDGNEALQLFRSARSTGTPFDVVILDLTVPGGMGARQTIRLLQDVDPAVRAIVASGYSSDPILARHREHGFIGAITKPFDMQQLGTLLAKVVG